MSHHIKTKLPLFISLIICFSWHAAAQVDLPPIPITIAETHTSHYIYETINVPGIEFLEVKGTNDYGHYAGNTKNTDGKLVGFPLISGVLSTYDVPDSRQTTIVGFTKTHNYKEEKNVPLYSIDSNSFDSMLSDFTWCICCGRTG
ncbi:hypothetical protein J4G08_13020 [Candidatus Poribacteria bacterium]|nr:hypothetical protein [Candidatus Poribacteria bacterium]